MQAAIGTNRLLGEEARARARSTPKQASWEQLVIELKRRLLKRGPQPSGRGVWWPAKITVARAGEVSVIAVSISKARGPTRLRLLVVVCAIVTAWTGAVAAVALGAEGELDYQGGREVSEATGVVVSPGGKHVYATSFAGGTLTALVKGAGSLTIAEVETDGIAGVDGLAGATGVDISPDGKHVYVASATDDALAAFARNSATGKLDFVEAEKDSALTDGLDGAHDVSVAPDGKHVYVASAIDDAVTVFARDAGTGALAFVQTFKDGVGVVDFLNGARGVSIAADGRHVYVASRNDDSVTVFARNAATGVLGFVESENDGFGADGLNGAYGVTVSPDGAHVYVASIVGAVAAFSRNPGTGALDFVEAEKDGGMVSLAGARGVAVSPDGKHVYVAAFDDNAVTLLGRDPGTGELDFATSYGGSSGGITGNGYVDAFAVTVAPDGRHVYSTSQTDPYGSVDLFTREADSTAPETTIISGPDRRSVVASATFLFESDDPGFTLGFECRLDGAAFAPCSSPLTIGPLSPSPHSFAVRAVDTAGNVDPSPARARFNDPDADATVEGSASAKGKQKQRKRRQIVVGAKVRAGEELTAEATGKVKVKKRTYRLKSQDRRLAAGQSKAVKLRTKKRRHARRIIRALKRGKKATAKLEVKLSDNAGNRTKTKLKVKLKR